jgi:hypothetical protein
MVEMEVRSGRRTGALVERLVPSRRVRVIGMETGRWESTSRGMRQRGSAAMTQR